MISAPARGPVIRHRTYTLEERTSRLPCGPRPVIPSLYSFPFVSEDNIKIRGVMFGGLDAIPFDPLIDAYPGECFNCRRVTNPPHTRRQCPYPKNPRRLCFNCGRWDVDLSDCPRCAKAHARDMAILDAEREAKRQQELRDREEMIFGCQEETEEDQHVELISPEEFLLPLGRVRVPPELSCDVRITEEAFGKVSDSHWRTNWPRRLPVDRWAPPTESNENLLEEASSGPSEEMEADVVPAAQPNRLQLMAEILRLLPDTTSREREILWVASTDLLPLALEVLKLSTSFTSREREFLFETLEKPN